ncbi:MAG: N-acetyl-gamma-glutamyl-phosphate reductase [Chitinivibrionales bacterium]|nr:N-acetyl-gamma-glutamyl-phosphate reductase [Chitinivibrionales bacterium]
MHTVFIDGHSGTTGLKIREYLQGRDDIELIEIPPEQRKDSSAKKSYLNDAEVVILCLPDDAARESVSLIENPAVKVIDASTAHRVADGWAYGLPELNPAQREAIKNTKRVTNPGCHSTGFILALFPLIDAGIVPRDYPVTVCSITGYSGGGKRLIAAYKEGRNEGDPLTAPRPYSLTLRHKHLPEMQRICGLYHPPLFMPVVGDFSQGMAVSVPLAVRSLAKKVGPDDIARILAEHYRDEPFIHVLPPNDSEHLDGGFLSPVECNGTNRLDLFVFGHDEQVLVAARFDNLGKGASGAAVQNLNLMLGVSETTGLRA